MALPDHRTPWWRRKPRVIDQAPAGGHPPPRPGRPATLPCQGMPPCGRQRRARSVGVDEGGFLAVRRPLAGNDAHRCHGDPRARFRKSLLGHFSGADGRPLYLAA